MSEEKGKHTPGPWAPVVTKFMGGRPAETRGCFVTAPDAEDTLICESTTPANAALIAAAPDLLAACEGLQVACERGLEKVDVLFGAPMPQVTVTMSRAQASAVVAAIAKAKGTP